VRLPEKLEPKFRVAIEEFLERLRVELQDDFEAYLFGSLARGDYLIDSDVDIIIVTDRLVGMKPWERLAYLRRLAPRNMGFDILCYTREEFREAQETLTDIIKIK